MSTHVPMQATEELMRKARNTSTVGGYVEEVEEEGGGGGAVQRWEESQGHDKQIQKPHITEQTGFLVDP